MAKKPPKTISGLTEHRKNFVKLLNKFTAYGYNRYNVFNDFLQMTALAIANNCDPYNLANPPEVVEKREKIYSTVSKRYKPEALELFPQMLVELQEEMQTYCPDHLTDVLGELFMELGFGDQWKGQCFTPHCVCDSMGRITFSHVADVQALIDEEGFVTVNDCAVGAGAIILGAANAMTHYGFNPQRQMLIKVNDIDERCIWMCYIQLSLYGLPAIVLRQNTLTLEIFDAPWFTPIFVVNGWTLKARRAFQSTEPAIENPPPVERSEPQRFGQLSLF